MISFGVIDESFSFGKVVDFFSEGVISELWTYENGSGALIQGIITDDGFNIITDDGQVIIP